MPSIARSIVEMIHDHQPAAVVAADRGGRILGLAVHYSWDKRYPDEPFPTLDHTVHFARISKSMPEEKAILAGREALQRAGVGLDSSGARQDDGCPRRPRVLLLDDWVYRGETYRLFSAAAKAEHIPQRHVMIATMCGRQNAFVRNWPERIPRRIYHRSPQGFRDRSGSAWGDNSKRIGVDYRGYDSDELTLVRTPESRKVRRELIDAIDSYYEPFSVALAAGKVVACRCVTTHAVQPVDQTSS